MECWADVRKKNLRCAFTSLPISSYNSDMSELTIPQELLDEASKDSFIGNRLTVSPDHKPLLFHDENGTPIGFQLPSKSKSLNRPMTGSIFISQKHRNKGYATQALAAFLEEHPDAVSFVNRKNTASRAAHAKAGWTDTERGVIGNRKATVWSRKLAAITSEDIARSLSEGGHRSTITSQDIADLAKAYRDTEKEHTKFHVPIGAGVGGLLGSGLGAWAFKPQHPVLGAVVGLGAGGGFGALSGYLHRRKRLNMKENLGRELGLVAQRGLSKESSMHKTASQIADDVIYKIAMRLPGLEIIQAVGRSNKNPLDMALRLKKVQALREAPDSVRELERRMRRRPLRDFSKFGPSNGPLFNRGTGPTDPITKKRIPLSAWPS